MCLAADAPVFQGHFPGNPTVPGVYLIEAMAQTLAFHQRLILIRTRMFFSRRLNRQSFEVLFVLVTSL